MYHFESSMRDKLTSVVVFPSFHFSVNIHFNPTYDVVREVMKKTYLRVSNIMQHNLKLAEIFYVHDSLRMQSIHIFLDKERARLPTSVDVLDFTSEGTFGGKRGERKELIKKNERIIERYREQIEESRKMITRSTSPSFRHHPLTIFLLEGRDGRYQKQICRRLSKGVNQMHERLSERFIIDLECQRKLCASRA